MTERTATDDATISDWIQRRAIPIEHLEPGNGWADLAALRGLIGDAQVVGLGESAHGVHEFTTLKHRLTEWLVSELGFTAIALESSTSGCRAINDYVLRGEGDPAAALTGQGYLAWDCEEFLELLRWLREHNESVDDDRKVAFYGVDNGFNDIGRQIVLDYLTRLAPERLDPVRDAFGSLADLESRWPFLQDDDNPALEKAYGQLRDLDQYLDDNAPRLAEQSSAAELADVRHLLTVMLLWTEPGADQSRHLMGRNLLTVLDGERPDVKVIVWQANAHVGRAFRFSEDPTLGDLVTDRLGTGYRAIGLEFGQGSYLTRTIADDALAELTPTIMPPPPVGSLPWHLATSPYDAFALDLRDAPDDPVITSWLTDPQSEHGGMWVYIDPATAYHDATIARHFDALVFVRDITPTRPTDNALRRATAHLGL